MSDPDIQVDPPIGPYLGILPLAPQGAERANESVDSENLLEESYFLLQETSLQNLWLIILS